MGVVTERNAEKAIEELKAYEVWCKVMKRKDKNDNYLITFIIVIVAIITSVVVIIIIITKMMSPEKAIKELKANGIW